MPNYRRAWCPGGTYFFTVTLLIALISVFLLLEATIFPAKLRQALGPGGDGRQFVTFSLQGELYGVPLTEVMK